MQAGTVSLGNEISVHRLGYGAMRLTALGIWGPPKDRKAALADKVSKAGSPLLN